MRVFLAGKLGKFDEEFTKYWTDYCKRKLDYYDIDYYITESVSISEEGRKNLVEEEMREIANSDVMIIELCDFDYHYLEAGFRIKQAKETNTFIIAWVDSPKIKHPYLLSNADKITMYLEDALDLIIDAKKSKEIAEIEDWR